MGKYKTIIKVEGKCVDDLFRLPCVYSITKVVATKDMTDSSIEITLMDLHHAYIGDYICEDYEGNWHVLSEIEVGKLEK